MEASVNSANGAVDPQTNRNISRERRTDAVQCHQIRRTPATKFRHEKHTNAYIATAKQDVPRIDTAQIASPTSVAMPNTAALQITCTQKYCVKYSELLSENIFASK